MAAITAITIRTVGDSLPPSEPVPVLESVDDSVGPVVVRLLLGERLAETVDEGKARELVEISALHEPCSNEI
jgi:hypothetical protein